MIRALYGGSFDPVHRGHRALVGELLARGLADIVHVIPASRSPFKPGCSASGPHRLAMLALAFENVDGVVIDDREIIRGGVSYTVETLRSLASSFPGDDLILVLGADAAAGLSRWREPDSVMDLADLVVVPRSLPGQEVRTLPFASTCVDGFAHPASSSAVRTALDAGEIPEFLLQSEVADYIRRHRLYGLGASGGR